MLDKTIHRHLDKMDDILSIMEADIIMLVKTISIDAIMENAEATLKNVTDTFMEMMKTEYSIEAINEGFNFADAVKKEKPVVVDTTDDVTENKELFE